MKRLSLELGNIQAGIECEVGSEGTIPIPRHFVYPVCGVPDEYEKRVYGNGRCTEYYGSCDSKDWKDEDTDHIRDEATNEARCMEMCADAGWSGCVYTHGGCNDPSILTFKECQGMWDYDEDGGFAGKNACHTSPGFSDLNDNLNDPQKAVIVIREINYVLDLLLEKLTSEGAATYLANYFDSMAENCRVRSGRDPIRPEQTCCVGGWVSTNGCDPDETRNYLYDQSCDAVIELNGAKDGYTSGYCSCEGGRRAMLSSCDEVNSTTWKSCNEACNDTRIGILPNSAMVKNDESSGGQWWYSNAGKGIVACLGAVFVLVFITFFCDKLCCRRKSLHFRKGHYLNHSMWTHPATYKTYNVLILLEIMTNLMFILIWVAGYLPYGFVLKLRVLVAGSDFLRINPLCTIAPAVLFNDISNDPKQPHTHVFLVSLAYWLFLFAIPVMKNILRIAAMFSPGWVISPKRRGRLLQTMDMINKWSLIDDIAISMSAGIIFQNIRNPRGFDILPVCVMLKRENIATLSLSLSFTHIYIYIYLTPISHFAFEQTVTILVRRTRGVPNWRLLRIPHMGNLLDIEQSWYGHRTS